MIGCDKLKNVICIVITCVLLLFCSASTYMIKVPVRDNLPNTPEIPTEVIVHDPSEEPISNDAETQTEVHSTDSSSVNSSHSGSITVKDEPSEVTENTPTEPESEENPATEDTSAEDPVSSETTLDTSADPTNTSAAVTPEETVIPQLPKLEKNPAIDPAKPMIVLSFDDGPSAYTERLLDILEKHGAKGTFFLVGKGISYRADTVKRMYEAGHDVGTHTWSHPELTRLTRDEIISEITMANEKLNQITGGHSYLVRPPYGSYNDEVRAIGAELGVAYVNWSVDTLDWRIKNAEQLHDKIISSARSGTIILCHDIHKTTVDAMETVIPTLISEGYQLVTFTEMMAFSHERLQGGNAYRMK